jgi:hypothetical protein
MRDDLNDEVLNETHEILISSNGVFNWDGILKLGNKPKGDNVTHFLSWIKKIIT